MTNYPGSLREMGLKWMPLGLPFNQTNLADANGDMEAWEASNTLSPPMPFAGTVVGLLVYTNADLTGGTVTFSPTVATVLKTALSAVLDDTHQQAYTMIAPGLVTFAAGEKVGIGYTKSGTVAPTTSDVVGELLVVFDTGAAGAVAG